MLRSDRGRNTEEMMNNIAALIDKITSLNKLQAGFLEQSIRGIAEEERRNLDLYIRYCLEEGTDLDYLAQSYNLIVKDTLREQMYFRRHKRYRFSTYEEAAASAYMNPEYMSQYMYGLALTSFLWPNHAVFKEFFLNSIPKDRGGRYLEIGPGHGFYFMTAMKRTSFDSFEGVDVSPTSVEMTRRIVSSPLFGQFGDNCRVYEQNFLEFHTDAPYDAIVMGEVLEHVEDPWSFLRKIREISREDSYIFITTCINSPAFDHIFLFESVEHLAGIIDECGLAVKEELVLPYIGTTLAESEEKLLPVNIAQVLQRR